MENEGQYVTNGVDTAPAFPSSSDPVQIRYNGLLARSGATEVYAHIGFNSGWELVHDERMTKTPQGFEIAVRPPLHAQTIQFCFRDAANNWDNNSGRNYSVDLYSPASFDRLASAEFSSELAGGVSILFYPGQAAEEHGVRGRALACARRLDQR